MTSEAALLLAAAAAFAVISGVNDGGAMVSIAFRAPVSKVYVMATAVAAVVLAPMVVGTHVATTLANRLVAFGVEGQAGAGQPALTVAVLASVLVVFVLSRLGLPTSLTLGLIGGIVGAGLGFDLPVSSRTVAFVLGVAALAPVVGATGSAVLTRLARAVPPRGLASRQLRRAHWVAFGILSLAYGANDGQKMLAVFAVALGVAMPTVEANWVVLIAVGVCFSVGVLIGLRRISDTLTTGLMLTRPFHVVVAEFSAAGAVLGSTAVGAPVSMTQSITGGLVGAAVAEGYSRVRWRAAVNIAIAWAVTLPAATAVAATTGWSLRRIVTP